MDYATAIGEFVEVMRTGIEALQHLLQGDVNLGVDVEAELSQIHHLINQIDDVGSRLQRKASKPSTGFA